MSSILQSNSDGQNIDQQTSQDTLALGAVRGLPMGGGKPLPETIKDRKAYVVEFDGSADEWHPQNWPASTTSVIHRSCKIVPN